MCFTTALTLITEVIVSEGGTENKPEAVDVAEHKSTMSMCKCLCVRVPWVCTHICSVNTGKIKTIEIFHALKEIIPSRKYSIMYSKSSLSQVQHFFFFFFRAEQVRSWDSAFGFEVICGRVGLLNEIKQSLKH